VSRRTATFAAAGLVVAYLASRVALLWRFPPHADEALFAKWTFEAAESSSALFEPLTFGQNPMQEWLGVGLVHLGVEPLTALRLLTVAAGLVTMGAVAWVARDVAGPHAGLAAASVWLIVPFAVVYGVIGLADPIVAALSAVAMALLMLLARRPRVALAVALGLVLGVGLLVKLTMLSAVWLLPLGVLLLDWRRDGVRRRLVHWVALVALAGAVALAVYQVLRLSVHWEELQDMRDATLARHSVADFLRHPGRWIGRNWPSFRLALRGYLTIPLVLAAAVGAGTTLRTTPRVGLYLVGWAVLPLAAVVALADVPFVRWELVAVPPLVVLAGIGVAVLVRGTLSLTQDAGRPAAWTACALLALALVAPALAWDGRTLADPATRPYPAHDDVDYVQAYSAGGPWLELVPWFRRLPGSVRVATVGSGLEQLEVSLRNDGVLLVSAGDAGPDAVLALQNTVDPLPAPEPPFAWRTIERLSRPRHGVPVTLSERVVRVGAQTAASPAALRRLLGSEAAWSAFSARYPAVAVWAAAWNEVYRES
jgi:Dolichyl-phosphate-mannose-protein mannosyltransferase